MEMIRHEDEFVQKIRVALIGEQRFEKQARPGLGAKQSAAFPRFGRDEVGLSVVGGVLARGFQNLPSGAKALCLACLYGTAEAVPFQNCSSIENASENHLAKNSGASAPLVVRHVSENV
jgi:hypothetical protein